MEAAQPHAGVVCGVGSGFPGLGQAMETSRRRRGEALTALPRPF